MLCAIDSGKTGAMAILTNQGAFVAVHDLPILSFQVTAKGKPAWRLNSLVFMDMLETAIINGERLTVALEYWWPRGPHGVMTAAKSGGTLHAILAVTDFIPEVELVYVVPMAWKRHFRLLRQGKDASLAMARKYFPDAPLTRQKDHNRAEALLIGEYVVETKKRVVR